MTFPDDQTDPGSELMLAIDTGLIVGYSDLRPVVANFVGGITEVTASPDPEMLLAWLPDPADGTSNIVLNTDLSWNIPVDANEITWTYDVFFDTDSTFASTTPVAAGPLSEGESSASVTNAQIGGPLSLGTYYWRVDSIDPNIPNTPVTRTGNVWSFDAGATVPVLIAPADSYDPTVEVNVDLEWSSDAIADASKIIMTPDGGSPKTFFLLFYLPLHSKILSVLAISCLVFMCLFRIQWWCDGLFYNIQPCCHHGALQEMGLRIGQKPVFSKKAGNRPLIWQKKELLL